jgi:hypothetical protein
MEFFYFIVGGIPYISSKSIHANTAKNNRPHHRHTRGFPAPAGKLKQRVSGKSQPLCG